MTDQITNGKIADLTQDPQNANKGTQVGQGLLEDSLRSLGAGRSIVLDRNGVIIAGNKTAQKAFEIGLEDVIIVRTDGHQLVAVQRTDLDLETDPRAKRLALADNRVAQVDLEWDVEVLAQLTSADPTLTEGLWTRAELEALIRTLPREEPEDVEPKVDEAEALRVKWGVDTGQVWQLGDHRIICGDCTDPEVVRELLQGEQVGLMVTDPPYGVSYDSEWRAPYSSGDYVVGTIENDDRADWGEVYPLFDAPVLYVWHGGLHADVVAVGLRAAGYDLRSQIIWNKGVMVFGRGAYHWKHEPCWYAVKHGSQAHWIGDRTQHTVWDCPNNSGASRTGDPADEFNGNHISQKPVQLMERSIMNHDAEIVADPFLGSGTTLIACERQGRKCRGVEISPAFVAVTLQRWADVTGKTPVRVTGQPAGGER
jgi:DNA modification methylase